MSRFFSLTDGILTLNSTTISGWLDDTAALEFPALTLANVRRGADGRMTAASTGDKGFALSIKLLNNSDSVKFLSSIVEQQKNGARVTFNGTYVNHINGTSVSLSNGILTEASIYPTLGKGESGDMEYTIEFETVAGNFESADFGV